MMISNDIDINDLDAHDFFILSNRKFLELREIAALLRISDKQIDKRISKFHLDFLLCRSPADKKGKTLNVFKGMLYLPQKSGQMLHISLVKILYLTLIDGYTVVDFLKDYEIKLSYERMRQLIKKFCISISLLEKHASWYVKRYHAPELVKIKYLRSMVLNKGYNAVARELNLNNSAFRVFCKRFEIQLDQNRNNVDILCSNCGKKFKRKKYRMRKLQQQKLFFCDNQCQGQYIVAYYGFGVNPQNRKY